MPVGALEPFASVARLNKGIAANWPDDLPNFHFIPGAWPTWGDFKRADKAQADYKKSHENFIALRATIKSLSNAIQPFVEHVSSQPNTTITVPSSAIATARAALAALTPSALSGDAGEGWQPIETAPKGETILGLKTSRGEVSAPVICGELYDPKLAKNAIIDRWSGKSASVTHWMPIPPLPAAHQRAGEP